MQQLLKAKWSGSNIAIAIICFIVGFVFTMQIKSVMQNSELDSARNARLETLASQFVEKQNEVDELLKQIDTLRAQVEKYQDNADADELLRESVKKYELAVGATAVSGEGVEIALYDSKDASLAPEDALIHQEDLLMIVNELKNAGAEAISINGIRLSSMSYIRCVGSVINVDGTPCSPPYTIKAIGNKNDLEYAIKMPGGIYEIMTATKQRFDISKKDELNLPMYKKSLEFNYVKEATAQ